jgi:hypothetical protein
MLKVAASLDLRIKLSQLFCYTTTVQAMIGIMVQSLERLKFGTATQGPRGQH